MNKTCSFFQFFFRWRHLLSSLIHTSSLSLLIAFQLWEKISNRTVKTSEISFLSDLGGKKKNSVALLFLYWLRQKFNTMTLSQGKCVKGNTFWRRFFLVKWSKVYFNIVYLGIQILWVCYPRTCQVNVLTKKLTVNHLDFQKQNCNIWKVTLRAITCTSHLYNLNLFLCQWTKGIFHASPPFNFEILTVHCTGCIVSLDIACVFISFPNVFPRSLRIQGRKHRRTL